MKTQGFSQAPSCGKREPGRNNPQLWTSNKTSPLPSPCHLCSPPKMPRNDHKGGEFMQLRNTLMGRRGNVEFWKEPLQVIKPSNSSGETQGRGRKEVKRNGHRTRARGRRRKGNKSRHHHHHHQDTTTGRETERFPWAVPRGKGATVSVKYKTQCPPAGGGSRRWDWFGIPRGAEGPVRSRKPCKGKGRKAGFRGSSEQHWDHPNLDFPCAGQESTELGEVGRKVTCIPIHRWETEAL